MDSDDRGDSDPVNAIASTSYCLISQLGANAFWGGIRFDCFADRVFVLRNGSFMIDREIFVPILSGTLFGVISRLVFLFRSFLRV